ncbi:MAG: hypothetical protein HW389_3354, partial [Bacteroidetes bacterium]|nr:hypothetical protein [Bacteroidota bacterium]
MADQYCATAPPMLFPALVFLLDIVGVGRVGFAHPLPEIGCEWFKIVDGIHAPVVRVALIAAVEHPFKRRRRQVG